jgi:hypothetical protein
MGIAKKMMKAKYQWVLDKAKAEDEATQKRTNNFYSQNNKFRDRLKGEKRNDEIKNN